MEERQMFWILLMVTFLLYTESATKLKLEKSFSNSFPSGKIKVLHNGEWGTICDDGWSMENTHTACRQLGYSRGVAYTSRGSGTGRIWLDDVVCTGTESSLDQCHHKGWGNHDCSHDEDVSIVCYEDKELIDVRLVGGTKASTGRVEIKYNNTWGTVCDFNWNIEDAHVICRMLGYEKAEKRARFEPGKGQIWLDDVSCRGDESSIAECRHRGWGITNCDHDDDIGIVCQPRASYKFRLVHGAASHTGTLQIQYMGTWGSLASDDFDLKDAHVVCRMIGFSQAVAVFTEPNNSTAMYTMKMDCSGHETSVSQCGHLRIQKTLHCLKKSSIGIVCKPSSGSWTSKIRLAKSSSAMKGRIEIQQYGVWGTVCNHGWSMRDANVVCRMLNYKGAITAFEQFGDGTGPIWLTEVKCKGDEEDILKCIHSGLGQTSMCSHGNDAGVICHTYSEDVQVRLVGDSSTYSGQVLVRFDGTWKAVCGYYWDIEEADVVCRMLKYNRALVAISNYGKRAGAFWLNGVRCSGTENSIAMCNHWGWGKRLCSGSDDAGVICDGYTRQRPNISVRLVDGSTPSQGRVEVRYYGVWGTVCQHYWKLSDAHVVCRMQNYSKASWTGTANQQRRGPIMLTRLHCRGNEKHIDECRPSWGVWYCYNAKNAGVKCEDASPEELSVKARLVGHTKERSHFGRVEVNYNGTWRPVCDDTWDISDAHVICRMLGYKAAVAAMKKFGSGKTGQWLGNVECSGDEVSISECFHRGWTNTRCPGNYYAGVMCKATEDFSPVQVRLEDGSSPNSGRVAVRYGNVWGTICNRGLDINDATVICRMLGYPGATKVYPKSSLIPGNGTIWLSNLECKGTEKSIVDCRHPGWGQAICNHDDDGAIMCKKANAPRFIVNDSSAVTESTFIVLVTATNTFETELKSFYQFIVEKTEDQLLFNSLDQTQSNLPSKLYNKTMATEISSNLYITGEVLRTSLASNFTIGDGQYYHGYYNEPLEPGSMYRVHVRLVTMAMDGNKVHSNASFVVFVTRPDHYFKRGRMAADNKTLPEAVVLWFSVAIIILAIVITGCFVRWNMRKKTKTKTAGNSGIEMTSGGIKTDEGIDHAHYQSLLNFLPEQTSNSCHGSTLTPQHSFRYQPTRHESAGNNQCKIPEPLYANIQ